MRFSMLLFGSLLLSLSACGTDPQQSTSILQSGEGVRLSEIKKFENTGLEALRKRASDGNTWIHNRVWARFGNYFQTDFSKYSADKGTKAETIARKVMYGKRYISQKEYERDVLKGFKEVKTSKTLFKYLTADTKFSDPDSDSAKVATEIKALISKLDKKLRFFVAKEEIGFEDADLYVSVILDTEAKQAFSLTVGDMEMPQYPAE